MNCVSAADRLARQRPTTLSAAVILGIGIQVASIPFFFVPGADKMPGVVIIMIIIMGLLTVVGCWGMWNLHRWGAILTLVVTFLNTITAVPGFFGGPGGWIMAELTILVPLSAVDMVLIALPSTWRAFRTR
ncbi:MAG: hypothetical protein WBW04_08190 [Nitrolancea sp.]